MIIRCEVVARGRNASGQHNWMDKFMKMHAVTVIAGSLTYRPPYAVVSPAACHLRHPASRLPPPLLSLPIVRNIHNHQASFIALQ